MPNIKHINLQPLISIIIPTFNRSCLLGETLDSVLSQTYQNWECIVVDDGSKDHTVELMKFYKEKDSRIEFYKRPNNKKKGAASCRNFGLEKSRGEFIQFLDSDDLLHANKLKYQIDAVKKKDDVLLTCKWGYFTKLDHLYNRFKHKQKVYRNFRRPYKLLFYFGKYEEFLPIHTYLIPKGIIKKAGNWNENLCNNDDAEFMTRILLQARRIHFTPGAIVFYRIGNVFKLSDFKKLSQANSAIKSLELISKNLKSINSKTSDIYVKNLEKIVRNLIKKSFPDLAEFKINKL